MEKRPRFTQICIFYWNESILVYEGLDEISGEQFYRCLGGGLDYGEHLETGLRREIMEEVGCGIEHVYPLGLANCVFQWGGELNHQIFMVYDARFVDRSVYTTEKFEVDDNGKALTVLWKPLDDFRNSDDILYPSGLLDFLERYKKHPSQLNWIIED